MWPTCLHTCFACLRIVSLKVQYLEARSKGRVVSNPGRDPRQGLDVAYLSALTTAAKLAEEEMRIKNHFVTQTMTLKVRCHGWFDVLMHDCTLDPQLRCVLLVRVCYSSLCRLQASMVYV